MVKFVMTFFLVAASQTETTTASPIVAVGPNIPTTTTTGSEILTTLMSESSTQSDAPRTPSLRRKLRSCISPSAYECRGLKGGWEAEGKRVGRLEGKEHTLKNLAACTKPKENPDWLEAVMGGELPNVWATGQDQPIWCKEEPDYPGRQIEKAGVHLHCNKHGDEYEIKGHCDKCDEATEGSCLCGAQKKRCTKEKCDAYGECPSWLGNGENVQCGANHKIRDLVSTCDPNGGTPCCSSIGWCGNTGSHCFGGGRNYRTYPIVNTRGGNTCTFPFVHTGDIYHECTRAGGVDYLWCAKTVNSRGNYSSWDYCSTE